MPSEFANGRVGAPGGGRSSSRRGSAERANIIVVKSRAGRGGWDNEVDVTSL